MRYFEDTLRDLVQDRIAASEARRVLAQRATFSFRTNPAYLTWSEPLAAGTEVPMTAADVRRALERYLDDEWTANDLRGWAEFITFVDAFSTPGPPPEDEDYYDDLWDVVHDLRRPEPFGQITRERVKAQLARLARYGPDVSPPAT